MRTALLPLRGFSCHSAELMICVMGYWLSSLRDWDSRALRYYEWVHRSRD